MDEPKELTFQYVKSGAFRVVKADGAWGGVTPSLDIFMALFGERPSIPDHVVHTIEDGKLGPAQTEFGDSRGGVVREVEVGINMDRDTAVKIIEWLQEKVRAIDHIQAKVGADK